MSTTGIVTIKELSSGLVVTYEDTWDDWGTASPKEQWDFMWTEGNYSCDCNRKIFFYRHGFNEDKMDDAPCSGSENQYLVKVVFKETGEIVVNEFGD